VQSLVCSTGVACKLDAMGFSVNHRQVFLQEHMGKRCSQEAG